MKKTHTPVKWINVDGFIYTDSEERQLVANMHNVFIDSSNGLGYAETINQEANSKLIESAPDLLQALESCLSTMTAMIGKDMADEWAEIIQAKLAIKKATE